MAAMAATMSTEGPAPEAGAGALSMGGGALGDQSTTTPVAQGLLDAQPGATVAWTAFTIELGEGDAVEGSGEAGFLYVVAGRVDVEWGEQERDLGPEEGVLVNAGVPFDLRARDGPATVWDIRLRPPADEAAPDYAPAATFAWRSDPLQDIPPLPLAVMALVTVPPGGQTIVHTHPGPEFIVVTAGRIDYQNAFKQAPGVGVGTTESIGPGVQVQKRNPYDEDGVFLSLFLVDAGQPFASAARFGGGAGGGSPEANLASLDNGARVVAVSSAFGGAASASRGAARAPSTATPPRSGRRTATATTPGSRSSWPSRQRSCGSASGPARWARRRRSAASRSSATTARRTAPSRSPAPPTCPTSTSTSRPSACASRPSRRAPATPAPSRSRSTRRSDPDVAQGGWRRGPVSRRASPALMRRTARHTLRSRTVRIGRRLSDKKRGTAMKLIDTLRGMLGKAPGQGSGRERRMDVAEEMVGVAREAAGKGLDVAEEMAGVAREAAEKGMDVAEEMAGKAREAAEKGMDVAGEAASHGEAGGREGHGCRRRGRDTRRRQAAEKGMDAAGEAAGAARERVRGDQAPDSESESESDPEAD